MYLYDLNGLLLKGKTNKDCNLFSINPSALKIVSIEHFKAYNYLECYKQFNIFEMALKYINISIHRVDGRSKYIKALSYVSVNHVFEILKNNEDFKNELMLILKGLN